MGVLKSVWLMMVLVISACQAGGDAGNPAPAKKSNDQGGVKPDNGSTINSTPSNGVGTLTGDAKCWKKMLETPEYLACKAAGKVFNRVKNVCVELGMTLTNDCSGISAAAIQDAHNQILKPENLPKAYLTTDQCGSYTLNGKKYAFAYVMGQQFFDDTTAENKNARYEIQVRKICYHPATGNPPVDQHVCADYSTAPYVEKTDPTNPTTPKPVGNIGSCD